MLKNVSDIVDAAICRHPGLNRAFESMYLRLLRLANWTVMEDLLKHVDLLVFIYRAKNIIDLVFIVAASLMVVVGIGFDI